MTTQVAPERRKRSIYEAVVYDAKLAGSARFAFPPDLARHGVSIENMDLTRAELRFGVSDPRGLGANPEVISGGQRLRLQPGGGSGSGRGFFSWIDAEPADRPADRRPLQLRAARQLVADVRSAGRRHAAGR